MKLNQLSSKIKHNLLSNLSSIELQFKKHINNKEIPTESINLVYYMISQIENIIEETNVVAH